MSVRPLREDQLTLMPVEPKDLHAVWDLVREDLERCLESESEDARIEDVYTALRVGGAQLYVGWVREQYVGCTVIQVRADQFSGRPILHLWLVYGPLRAAQGLPIIEQLARRVGANRITFAAPSMSYAKLTERWGFNVTQVICEKRLD